MQKTDYSKYILPAGLLVGAYFVVKNLGLFGGGNAGAQNAAGITDTNAAGVNTSLQQAAAAGIVPTIGAAQASGIASAIYNAGIDPVDAVTIINSFGSVQNIADLLLIMQAFGTKQAGGFACSIFGGFLSNTCGTYTLQSWITATLNAQQISAVNGYLANQNINYHF
jgi:hypothetical protein